MTGQPTRLWDKGGDLDALVHQFTVGDDPVWDRQLVHWDCLGSAAHARTLARAGLLDATELKSLLAALHEIDAQDHAGEFAIPPELEDCHTAIEAALTQRCGETGAKIHAGRSRNDQVATATRLFMRHHALEWLNELRTFLDTVLARARRDGDTPMPGYTHGQPAMPSSVGQWLHALAEGGLEQVRAVLDLLARLDACPLGTGAGFGVPLPLDRAYTAQLLGFTHVQRSPIDVQNSRGRLEKYFIRAADDVATLLEKLSCDLLLHSSPAFGFFKLPTAMTTGSSLMPQKKNPDVLELLRARAGRLRARVVEVEWVAGKLPAGYHRDLQLTKEPTVRTAVELPELLRVATHVIDGLTIDTARMTAAMPPEMYATHAVLDLAQRGTPFRTAYRQIAAEIAAGRFGAREAEPFRAGAGLVTSETWDAVGRELSDLVAQGRRVQERVEAAEAALLAAP